MATATKASISHTISHARGETWREATNAATTAVTPMATPPQPAQFRVGSGAVNPLLLVEAGAAREAKGLETRLRIHDRSPQDDSNGLVVDGSGDCGLAGFAQADQGHIPGARDTG